MPNNFQGHMSDFDKGQIIAFHKQNLSLSEIAKEINRPNTAIRTVLDQYESRDLNENTPSTGRPRLITART